MRVHRYVDKKPKPYRQIMIRFPSGVTCQELISADDDESRGDEKGLPGSYGYWWRGTSAKKRRIVVTCGGQSYLITNDREKLRVANPEWFYLPRTE